MEAVGAVGGLSALERRLLEPLRRPGAGFWLLVGGLLLVVGWGGFAFVRQAQSGLLVTGMRDRIFWGLYVALFEFFLGVGMAGTFLSAVLRLVRARWRAPVTRAAEIVAVSALVSALLFIFLDIGRPDRVHFMLFYGRWESPLIWDVLGVSTYLVGSWIYLYFGLVPDLAVCRDGLGRVVSVPRHVFFRILAIGWAGRPAQVRALATVLGLMTVVMVPVAVMMNAVASWIFSMTLREPWNHSMFGIYFVGGAAYSGVGIIVILLVALRRVYHLEDLITRRHFVYLGYLLAAFAAVMVFFNVSEFVTAAYTMAGDTHFAVYQMIRGGLAVVFWVYIWGGLILPIAIVLLPFTRNVTGIVIAGVAANVGMFLERYFLVVGGLRVPLNPYEPATYSPSWVEWSLMAGGSALFALVVVTLMKLFPPLSLWEMRGGMTNLLADRDRARRSESGEA